MTTGFERHVHKQVMEFLQTVLLIDDEAFRRAPKIHGHAEDEWSESESDPTVGAQLNLIAPSEIPSADELDVQQVSRSFADEGLSCAILSPQSTEENAELKPAFVKTARRADALILDWNLNGDDGKAAEKLVKAVLKQDTQSPRQRLRLIIIYTGEPDLGKIAGRVLHATSESLKDVQPEWDDENRVAFSRGPIRVSVFSKEHVLNLPNALEERRREVSKLPAAVVEEFGRHSMGLVPSAALSALAGVRNDGHRLLAALGPELDAAVLGQRIALNYPEDVERQVETLIGSELLAIVQDHEVGSHVGLTAIRQWIAHHKEIGPRGISTISEVSSALRLAFLAQGLGDDVLDRQVTATGLSKKQLQRIRDDGAGLFSGDETSKAQSNRAFSVRMSMRSRYSRPTPILQLGSIVEQSGKYAVCVQPLCDSVRIDGSRNFPLLPLEIAEELDRKAGDGLLTVRDERRPGGFVRLRVSTTPSRIRMENFKASPSGVVKAYVRWGAPRFPTVANKSWRWIGELKPDHSQRVVERLSSKFSRVGIDEAEVLRLGL